MACEKKALLHWLLLAATMGALATGTATAQTPECIKVYTCGCSSDGSYLYCSVYC